MNAIPGTSSYALFSSPPPPWKTRCLSVNTRALLEDKTSPWEESRHVGETKREGIARPRVHDFIVSPGKVSSRLPKRAIKKRDTDDRVTRTYKFRSAERNYKADRWPPGDALLVHEDGLRNEQELRLVGGLRHGMGRRALVHLLRSTSVRRDQRDVRRETRQDAGRRSIFQNHRAARRECVVLRAHGSAGHKAGGSGNVARTKILVKIVSFAQANALGRIEAQIIRAFYRENSDWRRRALNDPNIVYKCEQFYFPSERVRNKKKKKHDAIDAIRVLRKARRKYSVPNDMRVTTATACSVDRLSRCSLIAYANVDLYDGL